jgi:hypothetical protein
MIYEFSQRSMPMNGSFKEGRHPMQKGEGHGKGKEESRKAERIAKYLYLGEWHVRQGGPVGQPGNYPEQ